MPSLPFLLLLFYCFSYYLYMCDKVVAPNVSLASQYKDVAKTAVRASEVIKSSPGHSEKKLSSGKHKKAASYPELSLEEQEKIDLKTGVEQHKHLGEWWKTVEVFPAFIQYNVWKLSTKLVFSDVTLALCKLFWLSNLQFSLHGFHSGSRIFCDCCAGFFFSLQTHLCQLVLQEVEDLNVFLPESLETLAVSKQVTTCEPCPPLSWRTSVVKMTREGSWKKWWKPTWNSKKN